MDDPVDVEQMMVRARTRDHLGSLINRFPVELGECEVRSFSHTDYPFRIFVSKQTWSAVLVQLNEEISYDNFKSATAVEQGRSGFAYQQALHEVWAIMARLSE